MVAEEATGVMLVRDMAWVLGWELEWEVAWVSKVSF